MPLTHVSEWTNDKGMCRITPNEAADKYGKVSALDEILICDLCNQYVTLSTSKLGKSFFKHSRGDENKDCEERSKKISNFYSINKNQLETLDFRLNIEKKYIELIVPSIEFTNLSKDSYIIIDNTIKKILSQFYPSYIQVPLRGTYSIRFQNNQNSRLPDKINGFSKTAVFDGDTGKKLQENSDITTDKYYYVLTSDYSSYLNNGVNYNSIVCEDIRYNFIEGYRLFKIKITALNRQAGNFILKNFKLRLKNVLADLYPVWPPCINAPYKIYHNSSKIFMGLQGNYVMLKSYPYNGISQEPYSKPAIIPILCSHKEYLLTMGRNNPWKQLYINRQDRLSEKAKKNLLIKIGVTDINGTEFQSGISHNLPKDGKIKIKADYDGKVVCIKNGIVVDIHKIISGIPTTISNLVFGMTVKIYQGLDCLFTIEFVEQLPVIETNKKDIELYNKLVTIKGDEIEIPHALGAIISKVSENSKLKQWLYQKIRLGRMPFKALKLIKNYFKEGR